MKNYLPLFILLLLSIDVFAGVEEATTTFNVKSRRPVCNIVYPPVVDLGTSVNTASTQGGVNQGVAEFTVSVSCEIDTTKPKIRFWDTRGTEGVFPLDDIGVEMTKLTGATGQQWIYLGDPD
ncbi:hypothetical protein ACOP3E_04970 [Escherichia coli]